MAPSWAALGLRGCKTRALMDARGGRYRVARVSCAWLSMLSSHRVGVAVGRCLCSFYRVPPRVLSRFPGSRPLHRLCIFLLLRVLFLISDVSRELFSNGRRDARDTHRTDAENRASSAKPTLTYVPEITVPHAPPPLPLAPCTRTAPHHRPWPSSLRPGAPGAPVCHWLQIEAEPYTWLNQA